MNYEKYVNILPERFRDEFREILESCPQTDYSIIKNLNIYLDEKANEMTEEEIDEMFIILG